MSDPIRLMHGSGSEFERELLASVMDEPIPDHLSARMHSGVTVALGAMTAGATGASALGGAGSGALGGTAPGAGVAGAAGAGNTGLGTAGAGIAGGVGGNTTLGSSVLQGLSAHAGLLKAGIAGLALVGAIGTTFWMSDSPQPVNEVSERSSPTLDVARASESSDTVLDLGSGEQPHVVWQPANVPNGAPGAESRPVDEAARASEGSSFAIAAEPTQLGDDPRQEVATPVRLSAKTRGNAKTSSKPNSSKPNHSKPSAESKPTAVSNSAQPGSSLDVGAEVALLDAARQAISRGDAKVARQRLSEYERRFPKGVLRRDARVLREAADSP